MYQMFHYVTQVLCGAAALLSLSSWAHADSKGGGGNGASAHDHGGGGGSNNCGVASAPFYGNPAVPQVLDESAERRASERQQTGHRPLLERHSQRRSLAPAAATASASGGGWPQQQPQRLQQLFTQTLCYMLACVSIA